MPNKTYTNDSGKSTYQGIVLPQLEKVDDDFFKVMSQKEVDDKLYNQILDKFKKVQLDYSHHEKYTTHLFPDRP